MKRIIVGTSGNLRFSLPDTPAMRAAAITLLDEIRVVRFEYLKGDWSKNYPVEEEPNNSITFLEVENEDEWKFRLDRYEQKLEEDRKAIDK